MNEKFQYRTRPPSAVLKISSSVQVNPDNSPAMGAFTLLLFKLNTLQTKIDKPKPWCNDSGVLILHYDNDVKEVVSSQPSVTWYKSTNQKIGIHIVYQI